MVVPVWLKVSIVVVGVLAIGAAHYYWSSSPAEKVVDEIVEKSVEMSVGVDLSAQESLIDSSVDDIKKEI